MLCDIALKSFDRAAEVNRRKLTRNSGTETGQALETLGRAIKASERFVLSPLFVETAVQLTDERAISRSRDHLFAPADIVWVEWEGEAPGGHRHARRHAFLLVGRAAGSDRDANTILLGWGAYMPVNSNGDPVPIIFHYDLPAADRPILQWQTSPLQMMDNDFERPSEWVPYLDNRRLGAFLGASLALINTPRLSKVIEHDHSKLNKARLRLNRPAVLSYKDVRIMVDRGAMGISNRNVETDGRALHHVRAYLRIVRGKVQLMSPHWRGDPRFGVVKHRYIALRAEDEPGSWQGEVLPGPSVIKEFD